MSAAGWRPAMCIGVANRRTLKGVCGESRRGPLTGRPQSWARFGEGAGHHRGRRAGPAARGGARERGRAVCRRGTRPDGGPGDHRPWRGRGAAPRARAGRGHHERTDAGKVSGRKRPAQCSERGSAAVVAEQRTGAGGEPSPTGPPGGTAPPGITVGWTARRESPCAHPPAHHHARGWRPRPPALPLGAVRPWPPGSRRTVGAQRLASRARPAPRASMGARRRARPRPSTNTGAPCTSVDAVAARRQRPGRVSGSSRTMGASARSASRRSRTTSASDWWRAGTRRPTRGPTVGTAPAPCWACPTPGRTRVRGAGRCNAGQPGNVCVAPRRHSGDGGAAIVTCRCTPSPRGSAHSYAGLARPTVCGGTSACWRRCVGARRRRGGTGCVGVVVRVCWGGNV
jgi:hypothetical protein